MKLFHRILLIAISLLLVWQAFPTPDRPIFIWIALIPVLIAFNEAGFWKGFLLGEVFGAGFIAIVVNWFGVFGKLPLIAGSIHFGLYFALFFGLYGWYTKKFPKQTRWQHYVLPPLLWAGIEWFKSKGVLGFTWGSLGLTQYNFPALMQMASITGVYGISFVIVFFNNLVARTILTIHQYGEETGFKPWKQLPQPSGFRGVVQIIWEAVKPDGEIHSLRYSWLAFILLFPAIIILGRLSIPMELRFNDYESLAPDFFRVGIVQPNMPQHLKWKPENLKPTMDILKTNTKLLAENKAKMVLWPETAIPHRFPLMDPVMRRFITGNAKDNDVYLVTGIMDRNKDNHKMHYNTVVFLNPDGSIEGKYNKMHLVPLGEYFPLPEKYRKKLKIFNRIGSYTHGTDLKIFDTKYGKFQILICFESMFAYLARNGVRKGSQVLLILTNDAWFQRSNAAKTHFIMGAFRAVENRVWVVQAANTGVSGIIDPWGRRLKQTEIFTRGVVEGKIYPMKLKSIYTKIGDTFAIVSLIGALVILFVLPLIGKKSDDKQPSEGKVSKEENKEENLKTDVGEDKNFNNKDEDKKEAE